MKDDIKRWKRGFTMFRLQEKKKELTKWNKKREKAARELWWNVYRIFASTDKRFYVSFLSKFHDVRGDKFWKAFLGWNFFCYFSNLASLTNFTDVKVTLFWNTVIELVVWGIEPASFQWKTYEYSVNKQLWK